MSIIIAILVVLLAILTKRAVQNISNGFLEKTLLSCLKELRLPQHFEEDISYIVILTFFLCPPLYNTTKKAIKSRRF